MKTSFRTKLLTSLLMALLTMPPGLAFAGPEEANEHYEKSARAYEEGDFARAAELLERAYEEDSDLIYQYNRILALQADGKHERALDVLEKYEEPLEDDGRFDDIPEIREELEEAQARIKAGEAEEDEQIEDPREISDEQQEGAGSLDGMSATEITGWSLLGTGAATLGVAGLFGSTLLIPDVATRQACMADGDNTFDPSCYEADGIDEREAQREQFRDDRNTWETHQTLTWVFLGVGSAAALGGGALLLMDDSSADDADDDAAASIRVTPYAGAEGAGGLLQLSF